MDEPRRLILWTIGVIILIAAALWTLIVAHEVVLLVYVSALLAVGFSPIVRIIERRRMRAIGRKWRTPRWLAILSIYLAILSVLLLTVLLAAPPLVQQTRALSNAAPEYFELAQQRLIAWGVLSHVYTAREIFEAAPGDPSDAVTQVFRALSGLVGGIVGGVTVLILTFYMLLETESLTGALIRLFPPERRERMLNVSRHVTIKVSAWLNGQLLLSTVIGVTSAIGLGLIGVPYFFVLALISAVGEMIPVVGPVLAAIPAVAIGLTVSTQTGLLVAAFYFVQQQIENHVLVPKIMQSQVGVSAVTVIVAIMFGGALLGVEGVILAVPTAAILQVLFEELVLHAPIVPPTEPADADQDPA